MARTNLTSNKRSFRRNPRSFLDKITEAPLEITINDGVNPEYTIVISTTTGKVQNSEDLPPGTSLEV